MPLLESREVNMYLISALNDRPKQTFKAVIDGYDTATITIEFKPEQFGWFMSIVWGTFELYNERVATSDNILRQFKNIIPFGILIEGVNAIDPLTIDSWLTDNKFYMLDQADIEEVEALYVK
jgi:hypothetical protein